MGFKGLVKSLSSDKTYDKVIVDSGVIASAVYYSKKSLERGKNFSAKKTVTAVEKMLESL